jgi:hypothetical protein
LKKTPAIKGLITHYIRKRLIQLGHFRYLQHYNLPQEQTATNQTPQAQLYTGISNLSTTSFNKFW